MNKNLILIKLGGSLISDKNKVNVAKISEIKKITKQIKELLAKNKDISLLIFTGAGGFGHPVAEKYKNDLEKGLPEIKKAVKELNQFVVNFFNENGLKAISIEPDKVTSYKDGYMVKLLYGYIVELLKKNIIPVFHADLVKDRSLGVSILSMDKFLVDTAIYFKNKGYKIEKAIFLGTMPGVISKDGKTIPIITKESTINLSKAFYKGKGIDVTGGMKYKVEQCLRLTDEGIESYITNDIFKKGTLII